MMIQKMKDDIGVSIKELVELKQKTYLLFGRSLQ